MANKVMDTDEAVICFAYDLFNKGHDIKDLYDGLDNRGIGEIEILNSIEINSEEKIEFLKAIKEHNDANKKPE